MRFTQIVAAATGAVAVASLGLAAATPVLTETQAATQTAPKIKTRKVIVDEKDGEVEILHAGGSRLGIAIRDLGAEDVTREKLTGPAGALVDDVTEDSPAAKAGLKTGDVILAFDGERVRSARQLERLVEETPAGRTVKISLQRAGAKLDLDVTPEARRVSFFEGGPLHWKEGGPERAIMLEALPRIQGDLQRRLPEMAFEFDGGAGAMLLTGRARLGVRVQEVEGDFASYFGVKDGVVVVEVDKDSPASRAGVKAGDVITAVNGQAVSDSMALRREVAKAEEGKGVELSVTRDRKPTTLKVEIAPREKPQERRLRRTV